MWQMRGGDRVLTVPEWACLSQCADALHGWIVTDIAAGRDERVSGVTVFDDLTSEQKLLLLTETCEALVLPEIPAPEPTMLNEGTVGALFSVLKAMIEVEAWTEDETDTRELLLAAISSEPDLPTRTTSSTGKR